MPVYFVEPLPDSILELQEKLAKTPDQVAIVSRNTAMELVSVLRQLGGGVVLAYLSDAKSISGLQAFLKVAAPLIKKGLVKVLCTTKIKNPRLGFELQKLGVQEVIQEPVQQKSFEFKVKRFMDAIGRKLKQINGTTDQNENRVKKNKGAEKGAEGDAGPKDQIIFVDPLKLASDCWLTKGGGAKKIMGRWRVRLMGPSPAIGRWVENEQGRGETKGWKWVPHKPETDVFVKDPGAWVFFGAKPEFSITEERWAFVGKTPRLLFILGETTLATKFEVDTHGSMRVAKDSKAGLDLLPHILESLKLEVTIRQEKKKASGEDAEIEGDQTKSKELSAEEGEAPETPFNDNRGDDEAEESGPDFENLTEEEKQERKKKKKKGAEGGEVDWNNGVEPDEGEEGDAKNATQEPAQDADGTDDATQEGPGKGKAKKRKDGNSEGNIFDDAIAEESDESADGGGGSTQKKKKRNSENPGADADSEDLDSEDDSPEAKAAKTAKAAEADAAENEEAEKNSKKADSKKQEETQNSSDSESPSSKETKATEEDSSEDSSLTKKPVGSKLIDAEAKDPESDEPSTPSVAEGMKAKLQEKQNELSQGVMDALSSVEKSVDKKDLPEFKSNLLDASKKAEDEPLLGPLAFAFLVSELVSKSNLNVATVTERISGYLAQACRGVAVEFWHLQGQEWVCVGGSTRKPGGQRAAALKASTVDGATRISTREVALTLKENSGAIKAVMVMTGDFVEKIKDEYLKNLVPVLVGVVETWNVAASQSAQTKAAA